MLLLLPPTVGLIMPARQGEAAGGCQAVSGEGGPLDGRIGPLLTESIIVRSITHPAPLCQVQRRQRAAARQARHRRLHDAPAAWVEAAAPQVQPYFQAQVAPQLGGQHVGQVVHRGGHVRVCGGGTAAGPKGQWIKRRRLQVR